MTDIKVTIIVPVYNVSNYIEPCLVSIMNQTYQEIECVIVDDKTPDDSIKICERIIEAYSGPIEFRIVKHVENKGLSAARNTGIREAKGEYVYFLDSDDTIAPNAIELLCEAIGSSQMCIAGVKSYYDLDISNVKEKVLEDNIYNGHSCVANSLYSGKWNVMACNKLIRRDFLIENNLFFVEGLIHEDEVWSNILACVAISIVTISPITYYYRIRAKSIVTGTQFEVRINSWKDGIYYLSQYELNLSSDINIMAHRLFNRVCNRFLSLSLDYGGFRGFYTLYGEICHERYKCYQRVKPTGIDYIKDINYSLSPKCGCVMKYLSLKVIRCINHILKTAKL